VLASTSLLFSYSFLLTLGTTYGYRVRFRGRDGVWATFFDRIVVPGSKKMLDQEPHRDISPQRDTIEGEQK